MRITQQDIADKLGLSKMAVSMALRDSPRVSKERRLQVQKLAQQMGYVADPFLSRLAKYRSQGKSARTQGVIAWLNHWPDARRLRSYREFETYFRASKQAAKRLGYQLEEVVWPAGVSTETLECDLTERGVLGLLIPPHPQGLEWGNFDWSKFSLMRFGLSVSWLDCNVVTADQLRAMVMAVRKIHSLGYRRIGLVYNREHDQSMGGNYYGGFMWAHRLLNIEHAIPPLDSEVKTPALAAASKRNLAAWLKKYQPDAILTASPETPVFIRELGLRIPADIAMASMSPFDISVDAGVDQHSNAIGRIAVEMLIKQISLNERGVPADPCRILVESRWVDGNSLPMKEA